MSEQILYGLCELARELGLPESTTRYYRDVFAPYVPNVGVGRKRRYPAEALTKLRFIAESFAAGRTRDEILRDLNNGSAPQPNINEGAAGPPFSATAASPPQDRTTASIIEGEREQRELMWQMIRELSRFGDAIERQHYILSELVEHVFHDAERQLPAAGSAREIETVVDAEVVVEEESGASQSSHDDVETLRRALETERNLVTRLRQSKLELERRAASAEAELEQAQEQEPGLLRRLFERDRGR